MNRIKDVKYCTNEIDLTHEMHLLIKNFDHTINMSSYEFDNYALLLLYFVIYS